MILIFFRYSHRLNAGEMLGTAYLPRFVGAMQHLGIARALHL
jgi:hypothetical protein